MPVSSILSVEILSIADPQLFHKQRCAFLLVIDKQMDMVLHQTVGAKPDFRFSANPFKYRKEPFISV